MSTSFSSFLHSILLETAIDNRVPSGVVDVHNDIHRMVIAEKMIDRGIDPKIVQEVVNKLAITDGKYPERQAYNKEGWLVTFPTPAHKDAAIKKKTHFASDPTHGQGGMNLYYKRKGKQARQKAQDASTTDDTDVNQSGEVPAQQSTEQPSSQNNEPTSNDQGGNSSLPSAGVSNQSNTPAGSTPSDNSGNDAESSDSSTGNPDSTLPAAQDEKPEASTPPSAPETNGPSSNGTKEPSSSHELIDITVQFARKKGWSSSPYGDWTEESGQLAAVTALDGQVVPTSFSDRETLKSLVIKQGIKIPSSTGQT